MPVASNEQVLGLQIAVHDVLFVSRNKAMRDLRGIVDHLAQGQASFIQTLPQGLSLKQLGNDIWPALMHPGVIDGHDIRVVQDGGGSGFLFEAAQPVLITGQGKFQQFEGNISAKTVVAGAVDIAHPTRPDLLIDSVVTQDLTNHGDGGPALGMLGRATSISQ